MAQKRIPANVDDATAVGGDDLSAAVQALTQATQALTATAAKMMEMMQARGGGAAAEAEAEGGAAAGAPAAQVNTWEDDPFSEAVPTANPPTATPLAVPIPVNNHATLQTQIGGAAPAPAIYSPGTANFRYWTAAEAIARGINFWAPMLPPATRWTTASLPMGVTLIADEDLNANYTRRFGLRFYQMTVHGVQIFSGESPDVVCHELGHAILDAVRPQLFNAASLEVAAFHEAFGDMSAILSALQLPSLRSKVLQETQGRLNVNSRLSRLAEQLGWGIRQLSPSAVDPDSLRNAANRLFYHRPADLPPSAPASQLSSEAHSFSRVFTGAFLDALARMLAATGATNSANLEEVSVDLGQILIDAVRLAPITSSYYSQVAAAMIQADQTRNDGKYRQALSSGFIQHGILSPAAVVSLTKAQTPRAVAASGAGLAAGKLAEARERSAGGEPRTMLTFGGEDDGYLRGAEDAPELPTRAVGTTFGIALQVHVPDESERFAFAVASAAPDVGQAQELAPDEDAMAFLEDLIQLARIDFEPSKGILPPELIPTDEGGKSRKTHTLVASPEGQAVLKRVQFQCGLGGCCCVR